MPLFYLVFCKKSTEIVQTGGEWRAERLRRNLTGADRQYKIRKTAENSNTGALGAIPG
jgi:hypothetical protein